MSKNTSISEFTWKDNKLYFRNKLRAEILLDNTHLKMYRYQLYHKGRKLDELSDIFNFTRARENARIETRYLCYQTHV